MQSLQGTLGIIITSLCWGITDPLLKKFGSGIKENCSQTDDKKSPGFFHQLFKDIWTLLLNWKYVLTFGFNQFGSVLFVWTLANSQVSIAVPLTNSLKFLVTFATGQLLGEERPSLRCLCGLCLIVAGIVLQLHSKNVQ